MSRSRGPRLRKGVRLTIQDARGVPWEVEVERVTQHAILVDAGAAALPASETVQLELRVPGEGLYRAPAKLEPDEQQRLVVHPGDWDRQNDRAYARVRTYGLHAVLKRPSEGTHERGAPGGVPASDRAPVLDMSAGGARLRTGAELGVGEEVVCHFDLPGAASFELRARVVRVGAPAAKGGRAEVAVEFLGLDDERRSALLRWVFQEQSRRIGERC